MSIVLCYKVFIETFFFFFLSPILPNVSSYTVKKSFYTHEMQLRVIYTCSTIVSLSLDPKYIMRIKKYTTNREPDIESQAALQYKNPRVTHADYTKYPRKTFASPVCSHVGIFNSSYSCLFSYYLGQTQKKSRSFSSKLFVFFLFSNVYILRKELTSDTNIGIKLYDITDIKKRRFNFFTFWYTFLLFEGINEQSQDTHI